jgi:KDO2-lipid IV(A) lauroyltransferase
MYYLIKFVRTILLFLPLPLLFLLGKIIGFSIYLNAKKRRLAFRNIKSAFPLKTTRQINSILRKSFSNFGLAVIESLVAPRIYKYIEIRGREHVDAAGGGIMLGIHAGSWEVTNSALAHTYNFSVLVQQQKNKGFDKFLNEVRREQGIRVCLSLKELIKSIKKNCMIGMVLDHGVEEDALVVSFFSHLVPTPKGGVYLGKKFNKKIYPCFSYRTKGFRRVLEIGVPIEPADKAIDELLVYLNKFYENYLTKYPWEYYWYYKRFKHKLNRQVLILSDAKPGHLKQSQALVSFLEERNYKIDSKIIEIKYKNKFKRLAAEVLAALTPKRCIGWDWLLKAGFEKDLKEKLKTTYADIVISTGSSLAPLNKLFSSYLGAKSGVILRPNIPLAKFNLAIIPEHDRIWAKNVVLIKGALSYPERVEEKGKEAKSFFKLSEEKKIAFFLGGPLADSDDFMKSLEAFIPKLKEFSSKKGYKLLISTSRRTPGEAESYLEKELKGFLNTESLVIANRNNYDFVFEGFASLADIVFVSSESISMVSEIAALQKPCVCTFFENEDDKRKVFFETMKEDISFLREPYDIELIKPKKSLIFNKNKEALEKRLRKLL